MISSIYFINYLRNNKFKNGNIIFVLLIITNFINSILLPFEDYFIISILFLACLIDIKERIIPNELSLFIICVAFFRSQIRFNFDDIVIFLLLIIFLIISLNTNSIGMGDIKLFFSLFFLKGGEFTMLLLINLSILAFLSACFTKITDKSQSSIALAPLIMGAYILCVRLT